jgi:hypothetical protein
MNESHEEETRESTSALLAQVIDQGKRLAEAEFETAREELREDLRQAIKGLALLGTGAGLGFGGVISLSLSLAFSLRGRAASLPLLAGLGMLGGAAALALQGVRVLPKRPMGRTIAQVKKGVEMMREQITSPSSH